MSEASTGETPLSADAPPRAFLIISIIALVWNLFGVMSFVSFVTMSPEALAEMPASERVLFETSPAWVSGVFAIAVFGGVLGCVGLLLKRAWAAPVFIVSLAAVLIQFGHWLFVTDAMKVYGVQAVFMPVLVTAIAVFLVWYSRDARAKGWLR